MIKKNKKYAFVVIPRPEISQLCYMIPPHLEIDEGDCVEIELKKSKIWGIVAKTSEHLPENINEISLKPVLGKIFSSPVFSDSVQTNILKWIADYYIYPFPKILKQIFTPLIGSDNTLNGQADINKHLTSLYSSSNKNQNPELNINQKTVVTSILTRWLNNDIKPVLIFGVTGSGKSEIFSKLCKEVIKSGKQVLYLVPEIGLTSKALEHLINRIGEPGVILHSFMSKKKRFSSIYCAICQKAHIIVGTRSAIIYPFFNIGLIVVDEEHDSSYKNLEPPYYNARDVAVMKGVKLKIPVVLGSATPSSDSWQNFLCGKYHLEILNERANKRALPEIKIFSYKGDMYLPEELIKIVRESILLKEQTLFFLNRRGFATLATCTECNEIAKCPHCFTALIYHKKKKRLLCHHCNFSLTEMKCQKCENSFKFEGMGIEKLYETLSEYFPGSEIISFDKDNLANLSIFDKTVESITKNKGNIIVGTVMISKGHNFPYLKNVIIKFADYLLSFKDTRAAEKCFQLITQVAGRAGRFDTSGVVYAEAMYYEHYLWKYLKNQDYQGFMEEELSWRKKLFLPPFSRMILIKISGKYEQKVSEASEIIYKYFKNSFLTSKQNDFIIFPVIEPPLSRIKNRYKKNITVIIPKKKEKQLFLKEIIEKAPDLKDISVTYDIDPLNET